MKYYNNNREERKIIKTITNILGLSLVAILFFFLGNRFGASGRVLGINQVPQQLKGIEDVEKYKDLFAVRREIYNYYDGEIDENKMVEGAIKGMTDSLGDPYTVFMNKKEFADFMEQGTGSFVGIGVYVGIENDKVVVISPVKGSPAEASGLLAGDVIVKVDGKEIGKDIDKAMNLIKGEKGTEVKITVNRDGKEKEYKIKRDIIKEISVESEMLEGNLGYIRLTSFNEKVSEDFEKELKKLQSKGMKGLILDLRGNPGGYLNEAVAIASQFIPKGKLITNTIDKYDNEERELSAGGIAEGLPLVVLIDKGSASASEVVTGALRDYKVATIVGDTSFGKGVVQLPLEMPGDIGGLKVTVSRYYTPNGENIHGIGIKPDIEISLPKEFYENEEYIRKDDKQFNKAVEVLKKKIK